MHHPPKGSNRSYRIGLSISLADLFTEGLSPYAPPLLHYTTYPLQSQADPDTACA